MRLDLADVVPDLRSVRGGHLGGTGHSTAPVPARAVKLGGEWQDPEAREATLVEAGEHRFEAGVVPFPDQLLDAGSLEVRGPDRRHSTPDVPSHCLSALGTGPGRRELDQFPAQQHRLLADRAAGVLAEREYVAGDRVVEVAGVDGEIKHGPPPP
jgi:hypothetical protein